MEKFVLTREIMIAARDYIPLDEKEQFIDYCAQRCFNAVKITTDGKDEVPDMYMIDTGRKSRYLMTAVVKFYLGLPGIYGEEDNELLMTVDQYDRFAGSHVLNQIKSWQSDKALRQKCFDILADYYDLEKRFTNHLMGLLSVQNDSVVRQSLMMSAELEKLPEAIDEFKKLSEKRTRTAATGKEKA